MLEDDLVLRAIRQLAAALARTTAAEVRSEGEEEIRRADAALGRAKDALHRGDVRAALAEIDTAITAMTHVPLSAIHRLDARALLALAPIGGRRKLADAFTLRATVLEACGLQEEATRSTEIARELAARR